MHVALFTDQHPHSLGGVQTSVMLQKKYLNRLGVEVTIFAPKSKKAKVDPNIKVLPSSYLPIGREYAVVWSLRKAARFCEENYKTTNYDLVHVQGDFAAISLGVALARRYSLPLVYTAHTNIDMMANKLLGKPLKVVLLNFFAWQFGHFLSIAKRPLVKDAWAYMAFVHQFANLVISPSTHFANRLKERGIAKDPVSMITGVDDDLIDQIQRTESHKQPHLVWAGRMQPEKRLIQTIEAFAKSKAKATLGVFGFGPLEKVARNLVRARLIDKKVKFRGKIQHRELLQEFANADAVLQTSIDFETQGLTVYEALAVGTPVILCDPKIAGEIPEGSYWLDEKGTIEGLSKTLKLATGDIAKGLTKRELLKDNRWLRQSEISKKMLERYESLIEASRR